MSRKGLITALALLFVFVAGVFAESYTVVGYKYTVNGNTAEFAIENLIKPSGVETFANEKELTKALDKKKQTLWNTALFDRVAVEYSVSSSVDDDYSVIIEITVTDADTSIIFPYPKFDSNYGFVFGIRYKEKNLFGLMAAMDVTIDVTQQEQSFKYGDYYFDIPVTGLKIKDVNLSAELLGDIDLLNKKNSYLRFKLDESGWKIGTAKITSSLDLKYQFGDNTKSEYVFKISESGWEAGPGKVNLGFEFDYKPTSKPVISKLALNAGYTDIAVGSNKLSVSFSGLYKPKTVIPYMSEDSYNKLTLGVSNIKVKGFVFSDTPVFTFQPAQKPGIDARLYSVDNTFTVTMPDGKIKGKKLSNVINWTIYDKSSLDVTNSLKTNTTFSFKMLDGYTDSIIFKTWQNVKDIPDGFHLDLRVEKAYKLFDEKLSLSPIVTLYNTFSKSDVKAKIEYTPFFELAFSASISGGEINRIISGESFYAFRDNFRHGVTYSLQAAGRYRVLTDSVPQLFFRGTMTAFPLKNAFFNPSIRLLGMAMTGNDRIWFKKSSSDTWKIESKADSDYVYSYNAYTFGDYTFNPEGLGTILRGILNSNTIVKQGGYEAKAVIAGNINLTTALFNFEDMGHTYICPFYDFVLFFNDGKVNYLHSLGIEGIAIMDSHAAYPIRASLGFNADTLIDKLQGEDVELEYEVFIGVGWYF